MSLVLNNWPQVHLSKYLVMICYMLKVLLLFYGWPLSYLNLTKNMKTHIRRMDRFTHVCKFCVNSNFTHVSKSVHVTAIFPLLRIRKICIYANYANFALGLDQVQISICVYANFAYVQICPCDRKAKFAYVSIYQFVPY